MNSTRLAAPIAFVCFLHLACSQQPSVPGEITADEYSIYANIIDRVYIQRDSTNRVSTNLVVLFDSSAAGMIPLGLAAMTRMPWNPFAEFAKLDTSADAERLRAAFLDANTKRYPMAIDTSFSGFRCVLYADSLFQADFGSRTQSKQWRSFYSRFDGSNGVIGFSRVGFDLARGVATVFYTHASGELGFEAGFFFVVRKENKWTLLHRLVVAIS